MTSPLCWDNEARTSVSGYYLDPSIDFAISGDVAHAFDPRPIAGQLWVLEADRALLVEQSAKALHVAWPTRSGSWKWTHNWSMPSGEWIRVGQVVDVGPVMRRVYDQHGHSYLASEHDLEAITA